MAGKGTRLGAIATAVTVALSVLMALTPTAEAESVADARARAQAIARQVEALQPRVRAALAAYDDALGGLAAAVSTNLRAQAHADAAERNERMQREQRESRLRALYKAGGPALLYASLLDARSVGDAVDRVGYAQRVVGTDELTVTGSAAAARGAREQAAGAAGRAATAATTAREVLESASALEAALAEQQRLLDTADARVRTLQAHADARARLAASRARAAAVTAARVERARPMPPPAAFFQLYRAAAPTCPGLSWTVLAAIGQVESGHGATPGVSSAGAVGPMQFLPSTFAAYAVDDDGDGDRDIRDPADAVFSAARYLCANGAGDPATLPGAVWNYNHADWYVQLVLRLAGRYAG